MSDKDEERVTPLRGKRIVVTRARRQASTLANVLRAAGAVPIETPVIAIEPANDYSGLDAALAAAGRYDWLIVTSVNTVDALDERLRAAGCTWAVLDGVQVAAIGPATAAALQGHGVIVAFLPDEYISTAIATGLPLQSGQRVLLPRADIADTRLLEALRTRGAQVDDFVAYRTTLPATEVAPVRALLQSGGVDAVTFTSASTVRNLCTLVGEEEAPTLLANVVVACIGPITAQEARLQGLTPQVVADDYTIPGLVAALSAFFTRAAYDPD